MKNILFAASECLPFVKTGGLADVVGALPKYIDPRYYDCRVLLPYYSFMGEQWKEMTEPVLHFDMDFNWKEYYVGLRQLKYEGITFYFLDNQDFFTGNEPYAGMPFDMSRFAFFDKAALSILPVLNWRPDLIHCNDWQTGLIPVYLNGAFQENPFFWGIKTVMTIHNLKFQGVWDAKAMRNTVGLPESYFTPDKLEFNGDGNMLKGGLVYCDAITTVSDTYAKEICTPYFGEGLDGLLNARCHDLRGIVNGIDTAVFDPESDPMIVKNFSAETFRRDKKKNKTALQEELGLAADPGTMLVGLVSRLTDQKGFDLIAYVLDEICAHDRIQFAIIGSGEERYENMLRHFSWKYPEKFQARIFYDEALAHRIYAGSDAFLMPSRFEPCGLSQLISLRYGSLPIVRETGGLKDTVEPYNEYEDRGTGFSFANYNAHEMMGTIRYAERIYYDQKRAWNKIVDRAMAADFSWERQAGHYQELYDWLTG